jgi:hypothetical protein
MVSKHRSQIHASTKTASRRFALGMSNTDESNSWWGDTSVVRKGQTQTYVKHRDDLDFDGGYYMENGREPVMTESNSWWGQSQLHRNNQVETYIKPRREMYGNTRQPSSTPTEISWDMGRHVQRGDGRYSYQQVNEGDMQVSYHSDMLIYEPRDYESHEIDEPVYDPRPFNSEPVVSYRWDDDYIEDYRPETAGRGSYIRTDNGLSNDESTSWWGQTSVVPRNQVQTYVKHRYPGDY